MQATESKEQFTKNSMWPMKLLFMLMFAAIGVTSAFFPLYLKEIGLSPSVIGVVLFFRPLGGVAAGVSCSYLVKKLSSPEKALLCCLTLFLVATFSMMFMPSSGYSEKCPNGVNLSSFCAFPNGTWLCNKRELETTCLHYRASNISSPSHKSFGFTESSENHTTQYSLQNGQELDTDWSRQKFDNSWVGLHSQGNVAIIVAVFCGIIMIQEFFFVCADATIHGITLQRLGEGNSKSYGLIRSWGAFGHGLGATICGAAITLTARHLKVCCQLLATADYHYMFYVFFVFGLLACITAGNIAHTTMEQNNPGEKLTSKGEIKVIFSTVKNLSWLLVVVCRSMFYAVTQGFVYWHMENIGASPIVIGLANCITTTTEFLTFFATPKLIELFGETKLVWIGLVSYIARFLLFYVITNPLHILPVEVFEGIMYACIWSSIISYLSRQVSLDAQIEVSGVIQTLYMIGTSFGFLLSGVLTQWVGVYRMFLVFAGLALMTLVAFSICHFTDFLSSLKLAMKRPAEKVARKIATYVWGLKNTGS